MPMPRTVCCQLVNSSAVCQVALATNLPTSMIQLCPEQILHYNNFLQQFFFLLNFKCICTFLQVGSDNNTFYTSFMTLGVPICHIDRCMDQMHPCERSVPIVESAQQSPPPLLVISIACLQTQLRTAKRCSKEERKEQD